MFEVAELGRKVSKQEFDEQESPLRMALLEAQRSLRQTGDRPVIVIVSGVEGARKSEVVNRLCKWLDPRGLSTHAFWDESEEERSRPRYWRYWRRMPPRGTVGILFGSWYTQPIIRRAFGEIDVAEFERQLTHIVAHERLLAADGAIFVKLWFHLSKEAQARRLGALRAEAVDRSTREGQGGARQDPQGKEREGEKQGKKRKGEKKGNKRKGEKGKKRKREEKGTKRKRKKAWKLSPLVESFSPLYDAFAEVSEVAIRATDSGEAPWHVVEAENREYRDLEAGRILLEAIRKGLAQTRSTAEAESSGPGAETPEQPSILDGVDLSAVLTPEAYRRELRAEQARLNALAWQLRNARRSVVAVFEGWDASGKGGAIRRLTAAVDARLYRVIPVAAPSDEERAQHYLWRFWRHIPAQGRLRIFDRSWYGRVLVERVEGFAREDEWMRAYHEINAFEEQLVEHGIGLVKIWVHISPDEQLRRFEARESTPWKRHKITPEDWRNRERWDLYRAAVDEMVARTSTAHAPWTLVPGNDKRVARVTVLRAVNEAIEATLARAPGPGARVSRG